MGLHVPSSSEGGKHCKAGLFYFIILRSIIIRCPAQKRERKHWPEADCLHDPLRHGKLATRRPTRRGDSDRFISPTLLLLACYNRISSQGAQVVEETTTTLPCAASQQMAQRRRRGVIL